MLKLEVYNRFSKSSIYFDICRENWENFEGCRAMLMAEISEHEGKLSTNRVHFFAEKMDKYSSIAITFAAMCLEAFIYDYAANHFSEEYVINFLDKLNLKKKWVVIPKLVTGKDFPTDSQVFEQLVKLRKERNKIVHYKSKSLDVAMSEVIEEAKKEIKGSKKFDPYQTIIQVLTELRNLDDEREGTKWWEVVKVKRRAKTISKSTGNC